MNIQQKIEQTINRPDFIEAFSRVDNPEQAKQVLDAFDLVMPINEVEKFWELVTDENAFAEKELAEDELANVAGGIGAVLLAGAIVGLPVLAGYLCSKSKKNKKK